MSTPVYPRVIWQGQIQTEVFRVIDLGPGHDERLQVEARQRPDRMGGMGWVLYDPIPTRVFSQMLLAAGVVQ